MQFQTTLRHHPSVEKIFLFLETVGETDGKTSYFAQNRLYLILIRRAILFSSERGKSNLTHSDAKENKRNCVDVVDIVYGMVYNA